MQLLIFFLSFQQKGLGSLRALWWAQMDFLLFGCFRNQVALAHFRQVLTDFGGLKWTRTIDLTLIRRVL